MSIQSEIIVSVAFCVVQLLWGYLWYSRRRSDNILNNPFNWFFYFSLLLSLVIPINFNGSHVKLWIIFLSAFGSYTLGVVIRVIHEKWHIFTLAKAIKNVNDQIKTLDKQIEELRSELGSFSWENAVLRNAISKNVESHTEGVFSQTYSLTNLIKVFLLNECLLQRDEITNRYDKNVKDEIRRLKSTKKNSK